MLARDPVHLDIADYLGEPLNAAFRDVDPFPALLRTFGAQLGCGDFIDIKFMDSCQHQRRRRLATQQRRSTVRPAAAMALARSTKSAIGSSAAGR
jgi:hypothetical protein